MIFHEAIVVFFIGLKLSLIFSMSYRLRLKSVPKSASGEEIPKPMLDLGEEPFVCVQLPIFNEPGQISGLLDSVCRLEWPAELLRIQILDDSDCQHYLEENAAAIDRCRELYPHLNIDWIRRRIRIGYKAGALNHGMGMCPQAAYFAIFDCDFRPPAYFLGRALDEFNAEPSVAAVQAAWSFRNAAESRLTRLQETMLELHFHLDHFGRQARRWVLNFNGTAGVWSASALRQLGGWSDASVTEDLLLSYRAELRGMRVRYVDSLNCSSELPRTIGSLLVQQRRWARGHGQVLRLVFKSVLQHRDWGRRKKLDALLHLGSYAHSAVLMLMVVLLPWWIDGRARWVDATPASSPMRLLEGVVWIVLLGVFARLYSLPMRNGTVRMGRPLLVAAAAPYFSGLILGSFVGGLVCRSAKGNVFERTPKGRLEHVQSLGVPARDAALLTGLSLFLLTMVFRAAGEKMWIGSGMLAFQALAVPLWAVMRSVRLKSLQESNKMPIVEWIRNGGRGALVAFIGLAVLHERSSAAPKAASTQAGEAAFVTEEFKGTWYDGQAELSSYVIDIERYGERRRGTAVVIFVTEPFSLSRRVKADPDKSTKADVVNVMKSNIILDFQTGIYDYNTMMSTFVSLEKGGEFPAGSLLKSSFSSQEWCGHVYEQFRPFGSSLKIDSHSYFDGEADKALRVTIPPSAGYADGLFHWARGMTGPYLSPGAQALGAIFASSFDARLSHFEQGFEQAEFTVASHTEAIKLETDGAAAVPRQATKKSVKTESGRVFTFWVAKEFPFAILKWQVAGGRGPALSASLNKTTRNPYWKLNSNASAKRLEDLGLAQGR